MHTQPILLKTGKAATPRKRLTTLIKQYPEIGILLAEREQDKADSTDYITVTVQRADNNLPFVVLTDGFTEHYTMGSTIQPGKMAEFALRVFGIGDDDRIMWTWDTRRKKPDRLINVLEEHMRVCRTPLKRIVLLEIYHWYSKGTRGQHTERRTHPNYHHTELVFEVFNLPKGVESYQKFLTTVDLTQNVFLDHEVLDERYPLGALREPMDRKINELTRLVWETLYSVSGLAGKVRTPHDASFPGFQLCWTATNQIDTLHFSRKKEGEVATESILFDFGFKKDTILPVGQARIRATLPRAERIVQQVLKHWNSLSPEEKQSFWKLRGAQ